LFLTRYAVENVDSEILCSVHYFVGSGD
jgi:hypothetical protein